MIILKQKIIHRFAERYGSPDMITCYSDTRGFSAISPQAILLINQHHLIVLYIGLLSNKLVQRVDFQLTEISNSKLKSGFFLALSGNSMRKIKNGNLLFRMLFL